MPTSLWIVIVVLGGLALFAVVWWSSGRAGGRAISSDRGTAEQRFQQDANRIATSRNRDGMGGGMAPLP